MKNRIASAREALRMATKVRKQGKLPQSAPVCIYDFVEEKLAIEVKFQRVTSMEGMYVRAQPPVILICSERPSGRQAYTCAHELGHHVFGHGLRVDEYFDAAEGRDSFDPNEWVADRFAGFFLMPKYAVEQAFRNRAWDWRSCDPFQVYVVAGNLGVGYQSLVQHMRWSLGMLTKHQADELARTTPKQMRSSILKRDARSDLLIVDAAWDGRVAADLQVGEQAILPQKVSVEEKVVKILAEHELGVLVEATQTGTERATLSQANWAVNIRVSRHFYVGRSRFRHLEDPDHERSDRNQ